MWRFIIYMSVIFEVVAAAPKQHNQHDGNRTQCCMYNGVCKDSGKSWMDNCFTFECVLGDSMSSYRLTGAGCKQTDGSCLEVGRRTLSGCDVIECKTEGIRVASKTVTTGCSTPSGCKDVGQYWHDGCTVYACILEKNQAMVRSLPHDRMRWPSGQYALFRSQKGCPDDNVDLWAVGQRRHFGGGRNSFSSPLNLSGIYTPEQLAHEFCVRQLRAERAPGYMTSWGRGSYCVFRSRGRCPDGFTEGFIMLDDNASAGSPLQRGALPDGEFGLNTGFFFCCRNDGPVRSSIELPVENPFVLIMNSKGECQNVTGMTSTVNTIYVSGAAGPEHFKNGTLPYIQTDGTDITFSLCYYEQLNDCGCVDESGIIIEANTEKTIDCVVKRCTSVDGKKVIHILEGGCRLNNRSCVPEGRHWSTGRGTACTRTACARVTTERDVTFESRSIGEGCQWQDTCKLGNSTWTDRCMTYLCNVTSQEGRISRNIVPVNYGCDDGNGNCYNIGENVTDNCYHAVCRMSENKTVVYLDVVMRGCGWKRGCKKVDESWADGCQQYRCDWTHTDAGFSSFVNATHVSCMWNDTCYKQDEIWSDGCVDYKCVVTRYQNEVAWKAETHQLACTDFRGNCVTVGHNVTENCVTYQCNLRNNKIGLEPIYSGCLLADRCIKENETYSDDNRCVDFICHKLDRPGGAVMQLSVAKYKCSFNNSCMSENDTWEDGCRTRKCVILKTDKSEHRSTAPVKAGCDDEGICRPVGYTKITESCTEYQCVFKQEYRDAFFTLIGGGCRSGDGQCRPVNSTWQEVTADLCVTYSCNKQLVGYVPSVTDQKCRDSSGQCHKVGNAGFSSVVQGKPRKDCACRASNGTTDGIVIQCSG